MRRVDHAELVDLAASVADGTPIDWSQAEARTDGDSRRLVSHLRLVERIASLHRSIPDDNAVTGIAAAVADRGTIDWDAIEAGAHGKDRRLLRHLRLVESISSVHRTMALEERTQEAGLTAPAESEQPSGPRWGQLVLLDSIGQGASSEVFRAWDSTLHQEVALKLLHDDGTSADTHGRLLDEARRLARVHHRHVVHVYGADEHDDRVGLWMELVRGHSLEEIVKTRGSFGEREAALIGLDLCAALAAVHRAGLLHRDIKAQNVMREDGGRVVLMDFGTGEELAGTSRLVGTPLYLAPEIFRGEKASAQTDIYSAGVLLYYLVTGQFPVSAASMQELARAHADRQRRPVRDLRPDLHESFVRVIERSLDSDPKRRYASAGELEAALRETIAPQTLPAPLPPVVTEPINSPIPAAPRTRTRLAFAAAAAVFLAVAAAVALIVWTRVPDSPVAAALTSVRRVAVMPMTDSSGGQLPKHFAGALTDELVTTLGQVRALTVKSVRADRTSGRSNTELARDLDVDALLVASLMASEAGAGPPRVRVNVQLVAAKAGELLWGHVFERPRGETLTLQADISKAISSAVRIALSPSEAAQIGRIRTTNPAAEDAYLLGKMHLGQYGGSAATLALNAFERAITLDPDHAAAHAGRAQALVSVGQFNRPSIVETRAHVLDAIQRALRLDPGLADAHSLLGYISFLYDWDWNAAESSFLHSLELNPSSSYAHELYLNYLAAVGKVDEAVEHAQIARRLDPESGSTARALVLALYYQRDIRGAENALAQARALEPNAAGNAVLQSRIDEANGRIERALEAGSRALELSAGGGVALRVSTIRLEALLGRKDEAETHLAQLEKELAARQTGVSARDLGYIQLALGNRDAAIDRLTQAVDQHDTNAVWFGVDPRLDPLRTDDRFRQLLARIGLPTRP